MNGIGKWQSWQGKLIRLNGKIEWKYRGTSIVGDTDHKRLTSYENTKNYALVGNYNPHC